MGCARRQAHRPHGADLRPPRHPRRCGGRWWRTGGKSFDRQPPTDPTNIRVIGGDARLTLRRLERLRPTTSLSVGYVVYVNEQRMRVSSTAATIRGLACGDGAAISIRRLRRRGQPLGRRIRDHADCCVPGRTGRRHPRTASARRRRRRTRPWSMEGSRDDIGVVGYGVYANGVLVASVPSAVATLTGLRCQSVQQYQVDAVDGAGNRSRRKSFWVIDGARARTVTPSFGAGGCLRRRSHGNESHVSTGSRRETTSP